MTKTGEQVGAKTRDPLVTIKRFAPARTWSMGWWTLDGLSWMQDHMMRITHCGQYRQVEISWRVARIFPQAATNECNDVVVVDRNTTITKCASRRTISFVAPIGRFVLVLSKRLRRSVGDDQLTKKQP